MFFSKLESEVDFALNLLRDCQKINGIVVMSPRTLSSALTLACCLNEGITSAAKRSNVKMEESDQALKDWLHLYEISETESSGLFILAKGALSAFPEGTRTIKCSIKCLKEANAWILAGTNIKFDNLIESEELKQHPSLLLANLTYCRCNLTIPMDKATRSIESFKSLDGTVKEVTVFTTTGEKNQGHFYYYDDRDIQVLGILVHDNDAVVYFFLPREHDSFTAFSAICDGSMLVEYMKLSQNSRTKVKTTIPLFRTGSVLDPPDIFQKINYNTLSSDIITTVVENYANTSVKCIHKTVFEITVDEPVNRRNIIEVYARERCPSFRALHSFLFCLVKAHQIYMLGVYS